VAVNDKDIIYAAILLLGQLIIYLQSRKGVRKLDNKLDGIHIQMNSRLDQLLQSRSELARGQGHAAGMKEEREGKT
jgi:hypothetical protein